MIAGTGPLKEVMQEEAKGLPVSFIGVVSQAKLPQLWEGAPAWKLPH